MVRQPADDLAPMRRVASPRRRGRLRAGAPADATDGPDADLPKAADQRSDPRHADVTFIPMRRGLPLSGRRDGVAEPHSNQRSQFTSFGFTTVLTEAGIRISRRGAASTMSSSSGGVDR